MSIDDTESGKGRPSGRGDSRSGPISARERESVSETWTASVMGRPHEPSLRSGPISEDGGPVLSAGVFGAGVSREEEIVEGERGGNAFTSPHARSDDESTIKSLRPENFEHYVGQELVKRNLQIACQAARRRREPLDHVLLHGPPGLGKTSLAKILARERQVGFKATSGPVIERPGDLAALLTSLDADDVLFIDEIHRLPRIVEEVLYPAMEDYQLDILIGQGQAAKSIKIELKPFTLVGATTRTSLLTSPLRDRFGMVLRLNFYTPDELAVILKRSASILGVVLDDDASSEIARRSRGTPRIANRILKRVRDYAQEQGAEKDVAARPTVVDRVSAREALALLEIDERGLDQMDRLILGSIIDKFDGGPVGLSTLSAALGEDRDTLEDVYEPYLIQEGFLARTPRGREASERAYAHLGRGSKPQRQISMEWES